ncbi:MAG: AraC family transcriptional regulator [Bryobacterales bacterium]|nr:AraC family transcriptional regulator [Bryobacterales bacterium]
MSLQPHASSYDERITNTLSHLDTVLFAGVSSRRLAADVGLSPSRLEYLFKQATGKTLRAYIIQRRLDVAAHLLLTTTLTIKEIASSVGFVSRSHFTRRFSSQYGCSPTTLRQQRTQTQQSS